MQTSSRSWQKSAAACASTASLIPAIVPGTTRVEPCQLTKTKVDKTGEPCEDAKTEMLVTAELTFPWISNDNLAALIVLWTLTGLQ